MLPARDDSHRQYPLPTREDLKKRLKKLQKINATEASWLERYSRLLPEDNNSKCSAALYVVEHFSSASHIQDTLLKVEVRLAHPTNDSKKSTRHTHNCGTHMLDTHVWQEPLPAFLNKILKGAPTAANARDQDWYVLNTEFMATGSLTLINPFARMQDAARGKLVDGSSLPFDISIPWMALAPRPQAMSEATNTRGPGILKFFSAVQKPVTAATLPPADTSTAMVSYNSAHVPIPGDDGTEQPIGTEFSQPHFRVLDLEVTCPSSPPGPAEPASAAEVVAVDEALESTIMVEIGVNGHVPPSSPRLPTDCEDTASAGPHVDHAPSSHAFSDHSDYGECFTSDPIMLQQTLHHIELSTPVSSPATFAGGKHRPASELAGQDSAGELIRSVAAASKPQVSLHVTTMDKSAGRTAVFPMRTLDENTSINSTTIDRVRQQNASRVDEALLTSKSAATSETTKTPRLRSASGRFLSARSDKTTTLHTQLSVLDELSDFQPSSPAAIESPTVRYLVEVAIPSQQRSSLAFPMKVVATNAGQDRALDHASPDGITQDARATRRSDVLPVSSQTIGGDPTLAKTAPGPRPSNATPKSHKKFASTTPSTYKKSSNARQMMLASSSDAHRKRKQPLDALDPNSLPLVGPTRKTPRCSR
ncbi:hypothetical protein B0A48_05687 [Cryoendolithus antarcticus]|uniref:Uncharacterized protein n=1 Tax=Cryoendolithus antarcticus TaxID=1507870 RepID=A0A1V8TBK3_9PEZI|nr:hypothetical protein B0A48_05687 [Cryoendolithus antarcticus]